MQRYFHADTLNLGDEIILNESDNHHLVKVMRAKVDSKIYIVDQEQTLFVAKVNRISQNIAALQLEEILEAASSEMPVKVTIACGLSKNDKLDLIVQKGTECGMDQFIPLTLERDVVKWQGSKVEARVARMQKISKEAAEQSHRVSIPSIERPHNLKQLIELSKNYTYCLAAYEEVAKRSEKGKFKEISEKLKPGDTLLIVFGSEGGIAPAEIETLKEAGFLLCSLGPRILRAETAPIYALSALSYSLEL